MSTRPATSSEIDERPTRTMRDVFVETTTARFDTDDRLAVVLADISADSFAPAAARWPDRVLNVGIREQAMVGVAGGLALTGLRPVVHSYTPFLVERPFEQLKISIGHQGVGAVLVSIGASFDASSEGRTHQAPGDVALLDTLPGWRVHVPGHPDEVPALLRDAFDSDGPVYVRLSGQTNSTPMPVGAGFHQVRGGSGSDRGVVLAVGPVLDQVIEGVGDLDVTVLYTPTVRPFDAVGLAEAVGRARHADVMLVEPYLAGTSAHRVGSALEAVPHRVRSLGVSRDAELRAYGTPEEHRAAHGLDATSIGLAAREFFRP
ncbi:MULTISPECIES: transketolase family protein [Actinoalloteichus]|uniref:Transketolase n=1 Tax=Actinoalloteichus caeruleus DSM 43889 TaxID=1120930 RepID=A0ABT1JPT3_ACTCY|nr:transketolase [Actinoalloteichus caeruleus]MCP2334530.1 transketolase [Actinoalloteichus caeruleus DSM 43889]